MPNNGTLSSQTGATVTANPLSTTTYTVTATDPSGCSRTGTVTVTVTSGTPGLVSCGYSFSTASAYSSVAATSLGATGSVNYTLDLSGLATPFNFDYNGITYNVFGINGNGWMYFGGTSAPAANTTTPISSALAVDGVISAWSGMSGSTVGYLVSGSTPNRTLTIQWGASALAATIPNSTGFSCQIILYEHNPGGGGILIKFNLHMLINLMN